jgi:hypothetical protein
LEGERGVGLNHGFFMNDQGLYDGGLLKCAPMEGSGGRVLRKCRIVMKGLMLLLKE